MTRKSSHPGGLAAEIGKRGGFASAEQEAFLNLVRTHEALSGGFARLFKAHGLSDSQYNALRILRGHGRPMPVYGVAADMVAREPDITRLVDRLEKAGLVERERCADDRRVVFVRITPAGKALVKKLDRPVQELHRRQLGHLGAAKLRNLSQLLCDARRTPPDT